MARTLLSTVYRLVCCDRIEYGAARCSAKCTTASGCSSVSSAASRSYSVARSTCTNPISRPDTARHALIRSPSGTIGVSESTSRSMSIFRRLRLSRMVMS